VRVGVPLEFDLVLLDVLLLDVEELEVPVELLQLVVQVLLLLAALLLGGKVTPDLDLHHYYLKII
jgi:hypothetical protein